MLQRIQSIFLLIAMLANLSLLLVPVWNFSLGEQQESLNALNIELSDDSKSMTAFDHQEVSKLVTHSSVLILSIISGILLLITIFMYNNRKRQISLSYINIFLSMGILLALVLLTREGPNLLDAGGSSTASFGFFMPVLSIIMIWLAIGRIRKDDDLVKSLNSDRIR